VESRTRRGRCGREAEQRRHRHVSRRGQGIDERFGAASRGAGDIWPRSLRLQVANADAVAPGGHYRVVAELFDGTLVHSDPVRIDVAPSCGTGCCTEHATPECGDPTVQSCVCAMDPFCCDVMWDGLCVQEGRRLRRVLRSPACAR
jgi:hypothetical protein